MGGNGNWTKSKERGKRLKHRILEMEMSGSGRKRFNKVMRDGREKEGKLCFGGREVFTRAVQLTASGSCDCCVSSLLIEYFWDVGSSRNTLEDSEEATEGGSGQQIARQTGRG